MKYTPENFEFKQSPEIVPKRLGVVLQALESAGVELGEVRKLEVTTDVVAVMDEEELARHLHEFYQQLLSGQVDREYLETHAVFQTLLAKAKSMGAF